MPGAVPSLICVNSRRPCAVGACAVPRPRRSGVWPFAQGHADWNPHPGAHLTTKRQRLPIASASVIAPGGGGPPNCSERQNNHAGGWHRGALHVCQAFTASFLFPSSLGRFITLILRVRKLRHRKLKRFAHGPAELSGGAGIQTQAVRSQDPSCQLLGTINSTLKLLVAGIQPRSSPPFTVQPTHILSLH